jgi:hypothetical protein
MVGKTISHPDPGKPATEAQLEQLGKVDMLTRARQLLTSATSAGRQRFPSPSTLPGIQGLRAPAVGINRHWAREG